MTITASEVYLLNKMNSTASKVQLGTLIQNAENVVAGEIALADGKVLIGNASGVAAANTLSGDVTVTNAGVTAIGAGKVLNAMVGAAAAIDFSKLAALTSGNILVGSAGNVATSVAMSGDVTISNAGVTAIGASKITNAMVSASAAIDYSKLATLTSGNILVGSAGNVATSVAMSGDVTISNTGVTAIGATKVTVAMLAAPVMREATTNISQAQMLALSTPVELVPAPGAGLVNVVDEVEILHTYSTAAYATGSDVSIEYATSGDNITLVADTFFQAGASASTIIKPSSYNLDGTTGTGSGFDVTANANKAVQMTASNFTNGDVANVFKVRVRYHVITLLV